MNMNLGDTRLLIETCRQHGLLRNETAYVLGTAYHETGHRMEPVRETFADSTDQAVSRLDRAWARGQLSWVSRPYWREGWFGRGYVQLTHRSNYVRATRELGADFVADPDLALDPELSAQITVRGMAEGWFTGKQLSDYLSLKASNYVGARRIVNGTDRARAIAEYAREYESALLAEGYGVEKAPPIANERRDGTPPRTNPAASTTKQATAAGAVAAVAGQSETVKDAVGNYSEAFGVAPSVIFLVIILAAFGWIFRERLRKWTDGDR